MTVYNVIYIININKACIITFNYIYTFPNETVRGLNVMLVIGMNVLICRMCGFGINPVFNHD